LVSTDWKVNKNLLSFVFFIFFIFRAFVYLTNLLYGLPLIQNVAIVSDRGDIKGYLKISIEQLQNSTQDTTNEQIKLMKTYKNACGLTKIVFDDETYFQVLINIYRNSKKSSFSLGYEKFNFN